MQFVRLFAALLSLGATLTAISPLLVPVTAAHAAAAPGAMVHIGNFTFSQPVLTINAGTVVTWVNDDDIPHTVVAQDKSFKSRVLDTGDRFSFTFTKAGQIAYFCSLHPHMTGKLVVKA